MEATCLSGAWGGGSQHPLALHFTMYNYFLTKRLNRPGLGFYLVMTFPFFNNYILEQN
jgi:hypothetical protein